MRAGVCVVGVALVTDREVIGISETEATDLHVWMPEWRISIGKEAAFSLGSTSHHQTHLSALFFSVWVTARLDYAMRIVFFVFFFEMSHRLFFTAHHGHPRQMTPNPASEVHWPIWTVDTDGTPEHPNP